MLVMEHFLGGGCELGLTLLFSLFLFLFFFYKFFVRFFNLSKNRDFIYRDVFRCFRRFIRNGDKMYLDVLSEENYYLYLEGNNSALLGDLRFLT